MLVSGGVKDGLHLVLLDGALHYLQLADIRDLLHDFEVGKFLAQLQVDAEEVAFGAVEDDQAGGIKRGHLPAKLGADGAAAAGDHDGAALDGGADEGLVELDGSAAEQILHGDVADLAGEHVAGEQLAHPGNGLTRHAGGAAVGKSFVHGAAVGRGHGDDDLGHGCVAAAQAVEDQRGFTAGAEHGNAEQIVVALGAVVVQKPRHFVTERGIAADFAEQGVAGGAGAVDQDAFGVALGGAAACDS